MSVNVPEQLAPDSTEVDSGLVSFMLLAHFHGLPVEADQLIHEFRLPGEKFGTSEIMLAAKKMGLQVKKVSTTLTRLDRTPLPAIAVSKNGEFFVLAQADGDKFLVHQPSAARPLVLNEIELAALWSGELILVASRASMTGDLAKFDFTWFIPAVVKYRRLLIEILLVSFALNLFALVTPCVFSLSLTKCRTPAIACVLFRWMCEKPKYLQMQHRL